MINSDQLITTIFKSSRLVNSRDEVIRPGNGLVHALYHIKILFLIPVNSIPVTALHDMWWPLLPLAIGKESHTRITDFAKINVRGILEYELKINNIMRTLAIDSRRAMQLLCDLIRQFHQRQSLWHRKAQIRKHPCQILRNWHHLRLIGVSNLIMSNLQTNGTP